MAIGNRLSKLERSSRHWRYAQILDSLSDEELDHLEMNVQVLRECRARKESDVEFFAVHGYWPESASCKAHGDSPDRLQDAGTAQSARLVLEAREKPRSLLESGT